MPSDELLARTLAPFVYFVRRVRSPDKEQIFAEQPAMRRLYSLWRLLDGICTVHDGRRRLPENRNRQ